ncbi:MAG: SDR family oxidoreductase [Rhodospirillaceae bacterium]|nr:SDR family oxidoreductase [Rhodospirillaceae bacterium]MBT5878050.1 SDR family oxidoreductase [Rhodospirillaceae bacterium]MBT7979154.1 SDR family oxidoreductase [Rhodospirillaceae bacterium]
MHELAGKSAIITGASRGIGAATAREFAALGASVVLAARTLGEIEAIAAEIWAAGGKATAVACDVSRYDDVQAAVERCQQAYGSVDILVNNAGVIEPIGPLAESDPDLWGAATDINYKGVYYGLRAAIPAMLNQGGGAIVNVSSGAATSALEGWSQYCSSKAGALSLTRSANLEYRDQGIQIVGLSPGTVATEMQVIIKASGINPVSQLDPSIHLPPEMAAKAIAWLCTKEAAEFAGGDVSLRDEDMQRRMGLTL